MFYKSYICLALFSTTFQSAIKRDSSVDINSKNLNQIKRSPLVTLQVVDVQLQRTLSLAEATVQVTETVNYATTKEAFIEAHKTERFIEATIKPLITQQQKPAYTTLYAVDIQTEAYHHRTTQSLTGDTDYANEDSKDDTDNASTDSKNDKEQKDETEDPEDKVQNSAPNDATFETVTTQQLKPDVVPTAGDQKPLETTKTKTEATPKFGAKKKITEKEPKTEEKPLESSISVQEENSSAAVYFILSFVIVCLGVLYWQERRKIQKKKKESRMTSRFPVREFDRTTSRPHYDPLNDIDGHTFDPYRDNDEVASRDHSVNDELVPTRPTNPFLTSDEASQSSFLNNENIWVTFENGDLAASDSRFDTFGKR
ncbi:hypothetical protein HDU92_003263 [Lobulomyces angularis]|nr:hypothetical protein HDU92_003263 [Lobulomyces angularis]